jgi:hypothetical protein
MTELSLGSVIFRRFEVPAGINFGGQQRLNVHRLSNGSRVIDLLGADDADIAFAGTFSGPDAAIRARTVDQWRVTGVILPLTWDSFFYSVILRSFRADYRNRSWIPYRAACTIVPDALQAMLPGLTDPMVALTSDADAAVAAGAVVGLDLTAVQAAVAAPQVSTPRSAASQSAAIATASAGQSAAGMMSAAEATLSGVSLPNAPATALPSLLDDAVGAAQTLSMLITARGYLQRVGINLAQVGS